MLEVIILVLLVMWLLGMTTAHVMGGAIHILLLVALVVLAIRIFR